MIDENIVYVKIKNGIFKCYKSEQMHKPIYYPIESKTNGYIDYYDVIEILNIDDLYEQCKKQKEVIDKAIQLLEDDNICSDIRRMKPKLNENKYGVEYELLDILKEVSE